MNETRITLAIAAAAITTGAIAAAAPPKTKTLAGAAPGLWELSGVPEAKTPVRECLTNFAALAQYEHRTRSCIAGVDSDSGKVAVIHYSCGPSDFGHTSIKLITPRNLKVDTQGISDGLPFAYVLEARRLGECKVSGGAAERGH